VARLSPFIRKHFNVRGRYSFYRPNQALADVRCATRRPLTIPRRRRRSKPDAVLGPGSAGGRGCRRGSVAHHRRCRRGFGGPNGPHGQVLIGVQRPPVQRGAPDLQVSGDRGDRLGGTESFGPGSGARACFSWSMACCPDVKHEERTAICVTQQGRDLRKRMLPPDPGSKTLCTPRHSGAGGECYWCWVPAAVVPRRGGNAGRVRVGARRGTARLRRCPSHRGRARLAVSSSMLPPSLTSRRPASRGRNPGS
jgi:hypothetical protein